MTRMSPEQRGDLAERMLPEAANLAVLVHGDGGPEDVAQVLAGLDATEKDALIVVLAGLVDPDQPVGKALGWLDHDEHGSLTVPASWSEQRSVRDLVLEPDADLDDDFVDQVAVAKFVKGFSVAELTDAEFLEAVKQCVAAGLALADIDQLRRWPRKTTENRVNRLRKQWQRSGRVFPELKQPGFRTFTPEEVVAIREKAEAGATDVELAMSYSSNRETIRAIVTGKRYVSCGGPIRKVRSAKSVKASREHMCGHGDRSKAALGRKQLEEAA
ncbi:hypothetical protein [Streptomyces sp. DHE17-7]|uniref:hypothetical protein n=1 Tax=Streptomyces sp. DHE17-7 TaxID=2759949 RepID=UPI000EBCBB63|nr:hypothetical protein [Streptomyces sp. DHE17-7]MBJ6623543.1 hypothetical protein [Streptomyces sp. DHE17-7]RIH58518.1 hypothetical protein D3C59_34465 [Streptomyces sp. SHP22-7]RIH58633.1 hypothetical protein D3C59_33865 [Streptomyces sp. SHP22-7]